MYLKSLTLKGFKSFADRTVMKFEPGVAAIVGPNGSGKSNISDAVLWVLGERNAKNLRGQSMEDVIFAGSSARKPVSVAEVELCLDNSDGTLPVDFSEVSIGRRMYRTGESEYLINGNIVRRMDVLDILHDSGLGTGTNSIISQGNLDSVLSSRPEDRRALIEEAAGILKHKERKAKSERKLAQMDAHLDRVHDITAEVERQLKPLERKAKKAHTYQILQDELADVRLHLAVEDLRLLQKRWDSTLENEAELANNQQVVKQELDSSEAALDALQQQLHDRGSQESSLNEHYRRAQASFERLNSTAMVVREKQHGYRSEVQRLTRFVEEGRIRRAAAEKELAEAQATADKAEAENKKAHDELARLETDHKSHIGRRNELRKRIDTLMSQQRSLVHRQETIQATQSALRENLSEKRARAEVIGAHAKDAKQRLEEVRAQNAKLRHHAKETQNTLEDLRAREAKVREELNALVVKRDQARKALDEARQALTQASAARQALEELQRAGETSNPLLALLAQARERVAPASQVVSHVIKAPAEYDTLIEALLEDDVQGILLANNAEVVNLTEALDGTATGQATLFSAELQGVGAGADVDGGAADAAVRDAAADSADAADAVDAATIGADVSGTARILDAICSKGIQAQRLIDKLSIDNAYAAQVTALVGGVYVVDSLAQALTAQRLCARAHIHTLCFATLEGTLVWPSGKITIKRLTEEDKKNSAVARRRQLDEARVQEASCQEVYDAKQASNTTLEDEMRRVQTESLKLSEQVAQIKGANEAAARDARQSDAALRDSEAEVGRLEQEQQENTAFLEKAQPDADELERELAQVMADLSLNKDEVKTLENSLSPLRRTIVQLSEKLSDARLEAARLSERLAYAQRMAQTRKQEISSSAREDEASSERIVVARVAANRADGLLATLASLSDAASLVSLRLEQDSRDEAQKSRTLHDEIAKATQTSREVRQRFESLAARLAEVRVEKGRLEVQVEAGVKAIVEDCHTSLETAMKLEPIDDVQAVKQHAETLQRRIKNMGNINPDAAQEYEEVSKRYDYLASQLEDMRLARKSLARIVKVIDERMKNDFVSTFEQVNQNFSEIFSTLFPGGTAHLSLVDPQDLEHTGVDVNAQPKGKRVKKMSLLSGGEKSMTAMALLFAVYRIRQTPFYILDEVEAALDDTNLRRLIAYLQVIRDETQFIMITHQRRTMESADILYGVSMQADGITRVVSQKLDNAKRKEG